MPKKNSLSLKEMKKNRKEYSMIISRLMKSLENAEDLENLNLTKNIAAELRYCMAQYKEYLPN